MLNAEAANQGTHSALSILHSALRIQVAELSRLLPRICLADRAPGHSCRGRGQIAVEASPDIDGASGATRCGRQI
jgi:hypothetical protein